MPLIQCQDCSAEVSDAASACIKCGRPMRVAAPIASAVAPVAIERTSKQWESLQLLAAIICVTGVILVANKDGDIGGPIIAFGVLVFVVASVGAWWSNG